MRSASERALRPHPAPNRGSGADTRCLTREPTRFNLQMNGARPWLVGAHHGQVFAPVSVSLPQRDFSLWDQERISAPKRSYPRQMQSNHISAELHDTQRRETAW